MSMGYKSKFLVFQWKSCRNTNSIFAEIVHLFKKIKKKSLTNNYLKYVYADKNPFWEKKNHREVLLHFGKKSCWKTDVLKTMSVVKKIRNSELKNRYHQEVLVYQRVFLEYIINVINSEKEKLSYLFLISQYNKSSSLVLHAQADCWKGKKGKFDSF